MDVKLKREVKIPYEDFNADEGLQTLVLEADSIVPISIVTKWLAKEYEIFEPYLDKFYIDFDKLMPSKTYVPDDINFLILEYDDFYDADIAGTLEEVSKKLGITDEDFEEYSKLSHQEKMDRLDAAIAKLDRQ